MDEHSRVQQSRPSMAPPPFGYYPKPPSWTAAIFEKHVGKMPSATGYSTTQIDTVFFRLQMEILMLESRQSLDANTMWFRREVDQLRVERAGLLRAGDEAASARLAHERAQIAHRNEQTTHERVLRVHENTERTLRDIVREGNERNAVLSTQLASAQLANESARVAQMDLQTVHERAQLDHEKSKCALEKQIREGRNKYVTSESEVYLLKRDIAIINKNHQDEKRKFEEELRAIKQEKDDLQARCADFESQSSRSIIRFVNKNQEVRQRDSHIENTWSQALQSIMKSTVNDRIDIDNSVLSTILPPSISSIDKFAFKEQQQYCFAQSYFATSFFTQSFFGRSFNLREFQGEHDSYEEFDTLVPASQRKLSLLDLISQGAGLKCPGIGHDLDLLIYLERSLLQDTRSRQTSDTAVLFAFDYLIRVTKSFYNEFVHSIACVHLAVLGMQYVMYDRAEWFRLVREIITNENVTHEPVINACHAYLALSTHDPKALMEPELASAFELGRFSASTPIANIVSLANGAHSGTVNGIDIVVAQSYEWEVVFFKSTSAQVWSCSVGCMNVKMIEEGLCEMKWGPDSDHQIVCNISDISESDLGYYLRNWHDIELASAGMDGDSR
ncbi:hypothetical protein KCU78_g523, partial [Aureobasidium melanogenum]